ncbi:MAG: pentapeptide repeat-containing protein [Flavobacteriales bacterium]|nr:pentapeptide repeat-containing protein [Flavobacteriales bacterium]
MAVCKHKYLHTGRPRDYCEREIAAGSTEYCVFHFVAEGNHRVRDALNAAIRSSDLWLEGATLAGRDLSDLDLTGAQLPLADLEGANLERTVLVGANFEFANCRSARLNGAVLTNAVLCRSIFTATQAVGGHFEFSDLSGVDLEGSSLEGAFFYGCRMDEQTNWEGVHIGSIGEECICQHERAASVYRVLGKNAEARSNYFAAHRWYLREMRNLHRAQRARSESSIANLLWNVHRHLWGYGVRPQLTLLWMLGVILVFGIIVYPILGVCVSSIESYSLVHGIALSFISFATMGGGTIVPLTTWGDVMAALEAFLGILLTSVFLVSLGVRFIHRK